MFSWALCWLNADWDFKPSLGHDYQITETGVTTGSYLIGSGPGAGQHDFSNPFSLNYTFDTSQGTDTSNGSSSQLSASWSQLFGGSVARHCNTSNLRASLGGVRFTA